MNQLDLNDFTALEVDGEIIYICGENSLKDFTEVGAGGAVIRDPSVIQFYEKAAGMSEEITFGFRRGYYSRGKWWPCFLFKSGGEYFRVDVHPENCISCSWKGLVASPLSIQIYAGVENVEKSLERARRTKKVSCPSCGTPFPRNHYIWASERNK